MILDFACRDTEALFYRRIPLPRLPASLQQCARRKLRQLHAVERLQDMAIPPGNRLEKLSGNRKGQFSIRVNDQYRICFVWKDGNAYMVEIVDYHK
jgi:toxin HigB-1